MVRTQWNLKRSSIVCGTPEISHLIKKKKVVESSRFVACVQADGRTDRWTVGFP